MVCDVRLLWLWVVLAGLGLGSVWGWWVGVGRSWFVLAGMELVGWGRSVVSWFVLEGFGLVGRG